MIYSSPTNDINSLPGLTSPLDKGPEASASDVFSTSTDAMVRSASTISQYWNLSDVYDEHIKLVKSLPEVDLKGVELNNPYSFSSGEFMPAEMWEDYRKYKSEGGHLSMEPSRAHGFYRKWIEDRFRKNLSIIAEANPLLAEKILPIRTFADMGRQKRSDSERKAAETYEASGKDWLDFGAQIAGSLWGTAQDPVNIAALPLGVTGVGLGRSALLAAALKTGGINAAVEAAIQPFVQRDNLEAGMNWGVGPAAAAIGGAFVFGAIADGAIRGPYRWVATNLGYRPVVRSGVVVGWTRKAEEKVISGTLNSSVDLPPELVERAKTDPAAREEIAQLLKEADPTFRTHEEMKAASEGSATSIRSAIESEGRSPDGEVRQLLDAAEADQALGAKPIDAIPDAEHRATLEQSIRHAVDPTNEPMPVRVHVPGEAAQPSPAGGLMAAEGEALTLDPRLQAAFDEAVANGRDELGEQIQRLAAQGIEPDEVLSIVRAIQIGDNPIRLAEAFRKNPAVDSETLPLPRESLQVARDLAALAEDAFEEVRAGRSSIDMGALVAKYVADPAKQVPAMKDLASRGPISLEQAENDLAKLLQSPEYSPEPKLSELPAPTNMHQIDDVAGKDGLAQLESLRAQMSEELGGRALSEAAPNAAIKMPTEQLVQAEVTSRSLSDMVRQIVGASAEDLGIQVRAFSSSKDLPEQYRAANEAVRDERYTRALLGYQSAATDLEKMFWRKELDATHAGEGSFGFVNREDGMPPEVWVATYAANHQAKVAHELVHALTQLKALTPEEVSALADRARKIGLFDDERQARYSENYSEQLQGDNARLKELLDEEAAAHLIEAHFAGESIDLPPETRTILKRLAELFAKIKSAFAKAAPESAITAESVLDAFKSGKIAQRELRRRAMKEHDIFATAVRKNEDGSIIMHSFVGENALDTDVENLARAKAMFLESRPRERIWKETGWMMGLDGQWRREVSDHSAKIDFKQMVDAALTDAEIEKGLRVKARMGDVLKHDRLYDSYPGLRRTGFVSGEEAPNSAIYAAPEHVEPKYKKLLPLGVISQGLEGNYTRDLKTTLHEINHAAQTAAGLSRGANPDAFPKPFDLISQMLFDPISVKLEQTKGLPDETRRQIGLFVAAGRLSLPGFRGNTLASLQKRINELVSEGRIDLTNNNQLGQLVLAFADTMQFNNYRMTLGELESRVVERRFDMTPEQRANRPPWLDYGVPESLIRIGDRKSPNLKFLFSLDDATGQSMRRELDSLSLYSKALEEAKAWPQSKGSPQQILAHLKKVGVKEAELEATKLNKFLEGKTSVTRDELVRHFRENRVILSEEVGMNIPDPRKFYDESSANVQTLLDEAAEELGFGNFYDAHYDSMDSALDAIQLASQSSPEIPSKATVFNKHSFDRRNPTYRETQIYTDEVVNQQAVQLQADLDLLRRRQEGVPLNSPEDHALGRERFALERKLSELKNQSGFSSTHFQPPQGGQYIGHTMSSMVRHEGQPTYLLDQIQSDWQQAVRKMGLKDLEKIELAKLEYALAFESDSPLANAIRDARKKMEGQEEFLDQGIDDGTVFDADSLLLSSYYGYEEVIFDALVKTSPEAQKIYAEYQQMQDKVGWDNNFSSAEKNQWFSRMAEREQKLLSAINTAIQNDPLTIARNKIDESKKGIPGHPLINTTDTWVNLGLRRSLHQAVAADAEYFAVPTGDTVLSYNPGDKNGMRQFYGAKGKGGFSASDKEKLIAIDKKINEFSDEILSIGDEINRLRDTGRLYAENPSELDQVPFGYDGPLSAEAALAVNRQQDLRYAVQSMMEERAELQLKEGEPEIFGIVPKNLRNLLQKLDKSAPPPFRIDQLEGPSEGMKGEGFTLFQLTPKIKEEVRKGLQTFSLDDQPIRPKVDDAAQEDLGQSLVEIASRAAGDPLGAIQDSVALATRLTDATPSATAQEPAAPVQMFAMFDDQGRRKFGAELRAKSLQQDFADIEDSFAKMQAENPGDLEAIQAAQRQKVNAERAALFNSRAEEKGLDDLSRFKDSRGRGDKPLAYLMMHEANGVHGGSEDLVHLREAIARGSLSMMADFLWKFRKGAITGDLRRLQSKLRADLSDMIAESNGVNTNNPAAKAFAQSWLETAEYLRKYFNAVGGDIQKLDGWFAPQFHDADALMKFGHKEWVDYILKNEMLDRARMLDFNGKPLSDAGLREMLSQVWQTIITEGAIKIDPSKATSYGKGAFYKRHQEHRVLHFADHEKWLQYNRDFGNGDVYNAIIGHVDMMSKEIAAMVRFGANPDVVRPRLEAHLRREAAQQMIAPSMIDDLADRIADLRSKVTGVSPDTKAHLDRLTEIHTELDQLRAEGAKENAARIAVLDKELFGVHQAIRDAFADPAAKAGLADDFKALSDAMDEMAAMEKFPVSSRNPTIRLERMISRANEIFELYRGNTNTPANSTIAEAMGGIRTWVMSTALSGASMSSMTDFTTQMAARHFIGMPIVNQLNDYLRAFSPTDRKLALAEGIGLDSARVAFAQRARYVGWYNTKGIVGYVADRTHAFSFLSPMTQAQKVSFSKRFLNWVPTLRGLAFDELEEPIQRMFQRHHFSEVDWNRLRAIEPEMMGELPSYHYRLIAEKGDVDLANKFMGIVFREQEQAIVDSTLRGRTLWLSESKGGSASGEILRSVAMIKSFPTSYSLNIIGRLYHEILAGRWGNVAAYGSAIFIAGSMMGAMSMQMKNIAYGRNPEDMTKLGFWGKAFMQSGGLGIFGDFIGSSVNRFGGGLAQTLGGPLAGRGSTLIDLTLGNAIQYANDERTNSGRELIKAIRENTPGALVPFYLRNSYERLLLDELQKMVDPEYYKSWRAQETALQRRSGQTFYWGPGQSSPNSINWGAAAGQ